MSEEYDRRRPGSAWEQDGDEPQWRPGRGKPGGSTPSSRLPASPWAEPPPVTVQRKAAFVNPAARAEDRADQQTREDAVFDFTQPFIDATGADPVQRKRAGHGAIQDRAAVAPAADPGHDLRAMATVLSMPVQRRAAVSAQSSPIDAPRADSVSDDRATIRATRDAEAPAENTQPTADSGEIDSSKDASLGDDRTTIEPDAEAAPGPLTPERAAHAAAKNPRLVAQHEIRPADIGTGAAPDSVAFAQAVAEFQAEHGLAVDGVVGPKTAAAAGAQPGAASSSADPSAPAATDARGAGSSLLQLKATTGADADQDVHSAAAAGIAGGARLLPHLDRIQEAFGAHDLSGIQAHVGGPAARASAAIGAEAYATGNHVAFARSPDLHTAAHEAAHVVQQRAGVHLKGGIGQAGDSYEQHADAVADAVVRGDSAEAELDRFAGGSAGSAVQLKEANYSQGDNKKLVRLALQQAAATAKAGAAEPSAVACYHVANSLRHAVASVDVPQDKSVALRDLFGPSDLAYVRAAQLHDAASQALGDEDPAVAGLFAAMLELADLLAPAGWRRPMDARAAQVRGNHARRHGNKESFGSGDRASLVSKSLMTASHFIKNLTDAGKPITPAAFAVTTAEAHRQIEFAYDQMLDSDKPLVSIRDVINRTTRDVTTLERQALVLASRPENLADTVNLANQIRARVGLAPLPRAELTADEFGRKLAAAGTFIDASYARLSELLYATALSYHQAWTRHTGALKSASAQRLRGSLLEQAIVTAIAGGLGGFAAHAMKVKLGIDPNVAWQAALADGVKDVYKLIAKQNLKVPNVDALAIFPPDPVVWLATAKGALEGEKAIAHRALLVWMTAVANNDPNLKRTFDPLGEFEANLTVRGEPVGQLQDIDQASTSIEFEKGLWKVWLKNYAHTVIVSGLPGTDETKLYQVKKNIDPSITKAIDALGEDGAKWAQEYGGVAKQAAEKRVHDIANHRIGPA